MNKERIQKLEKRIELIEFALRDNPEYKTLTTIHNLSFRELHKMVDIVSEDNKKTVMDYLKYCNDKFNKALTRMRFI